MCGSPFCPPLAVCSLPWADPWPAAASAATSPTGVSPDLVSGCVMATLKLLCTALLCVACWLYFIAGTVCPASLAVHWAVHPVYFDSIFLVVWLSGVTLCVCCNLVQPLGLPLYFTSWFWLIWFLCVLFFFSFIVWMVILHYCNLPIFS